MIVWDLDSERIGTPLYRKQLPQLPHCPKISNHLVFCYYKEIVKMKYLYIRKASNNFQILVKVENDDYDYDEFLPLAIKHAIKNGYAVFDGWVFSCWDALRDFN